MLVELADAVLAGGDHGGNVRLDETVKKALGLGLELVQLHFERAHSGLTCGEFMVPQFLEHRAGSPEEFRCGPQLLKQYLELAFHRFSADRLAVARAFAVVAEVIIVIVIPSLGLAGRIGRATIGAGDEPAQRELQRQILSLGRSAVAKHAFLDLHVCLEADKRLVLRFAQGDAPRLMFDVSGVDHALEDFGDLVPAFGFGILGLGFQKALDFGLRLETAGRIAL